ncbi:hypothetical protein SY86_12105 [Erwinia tracheiphila]|uniref:Uncharacterized protein n=1 Tax=Erwinia tracheiphila TaxID=65700 RepID=A0A0M2KAP7_9GAMM|nr:hypothetical protein AV903_15260 [Erwinia tracheiphila]KKF36004.1 hypothetical protein SY86_12105 [Erwinia tracheiphila]
MSVKLSSYVWDGYAANGVKGTKLLIMARFADFSNDDGCSGQLILATRPDCSWNSRSDSFGVKPPLFQ